MAEDTKLFTDDFLDDLLGGIEEDTKRNFTERSDIPIVFLPTGKFDVRILCDDNGAMYNHQKVWEQEVEFVSEKVNDDKSVTKETKKYRARALVKPDGEDTIQAYADELKDWTVNARNYFTFYAYIADVGDVKNDRFKVGPCLLICTGDKFLNALKAGFKMLMESPEGKVDLKSTLNKAAKGLVWTVTRTGGQQGTIQALPNTYKKIEVSAEDQVKFKDVTDVYLPNVSTDNGRNRNEENYVRIEAVYKKLVATKEASERGSQPTGTGTGLDQLPKGDAAPVAEAKPYVPANSEPIAMNGAADLEASLAALTKPA